MSSIATYPVEWFWAVTRQTYFWPPAAPPAQSEERGPWENYRPPVSAGDSRLEVDPGEGLSEFDAAVLEECIAEAMNAPLSDLATGDPRLVTEAEFFWTIAGNA